VKKIVLYSVLVLFLSGMVACGGGGSDAENVFDEYLGALDGLAGDVEKAANADDVVKALNTFSYKMTALGPKMKKASEEMAKKAQSGKMPKEMEEMAKKSMEVVAKMRTIQEKMAKYATDPKVQAAQKKMMEAMAAMGK